MTDLRRLAQELEWSNYARTAYFATVVPGVQVSISSEVVLISDPLVPLMDGNHAAMLRAAPDKADALIERIIEHYQSFGLQPAVVISPGCEPDNLPQRLEAHGFCRQGDPEYWLTLKSPLYADALRAPGGVIVRQVEQADVPAFCRVMAASFGMPEDTLPILHHGFGHINDLPGVHNYLATVDGEPVGCASLFSYLGYGALGSAGVLPGARRAGVALALAVRGYQDWKRDGDKVLVIQTTLQKLERMLRIAGCRRAFARTYYVYRGS